MLCFIDIVFFIFIALLLDVDSIVDNHINRLFSHILELSGVNTDVFHLKLLIILFLSFAGLN